GWTSWASPLGNAGHYAIGRDPVILVVGEAHLAAMARQALLHLAGGGKVFQHLVAGAVVQPPLLVAVAFGVAPRDRRAAAGDVAVVEEGDAGPGRQVCLQLGEKPVQ